MLDSLATYDRTHRAYEGGGYAIRSDRSLASRLPTYKWSATRLARARSETLPAANMNVGTGPRLEDLPGQNPDPQKTVGTTGPGFGTTEWRLAASLARSPGLAALLFYLADKGPRDFDAASKEVVACDQYRLPELALQLVSCGAATFDARQLTLTSFGYRAAERLRSRSAGRG